MRRLRGDDGDESLGQAVAVQRRLGVQGHFDAVAAPVPPYRSLPGYQRFPGTSEGEPGGLGCSPAEERIGRGASYGLCGAVAEQPPGALAPSRDQAVRAVRAWGGRRDIG